MSCERPNAGRSRLLSAAAKESGKATLPKATLTYALGFLEEALKEWRKLDASVREQFKTKLAERLHQPRVLASKLSGHPDRYKIKLRSVGYRLMYEVRDRQLLVVVVAAGKRERGAVYAAAQRR